mgnify:CR=1 FL=1
MILITQAFRFTAIMSAVAVLLFYAGVFGGTQ